LNVADQLILDVVADLGQVLDGGRFSVVGHLKISLKKMAKL
jgi:hypothetical protein